MHDTDDTAPASPFHAGERAIHERLGIAGRIEAIGRMVIRDHMPMQHREFFAQLPWLILGAVTAQGQPLATILHGAPGFSQSPDPEHLRIDALPADDDPAAAALLAGAPVGLLGIELATRRRNRMNGEIVARDARGFAVRVGESFGNCPKYIQARAFTTADGAAPAALTRTDRLADDMAALVNAADTFFIASAHAPLHAGHGKHGVDVSHRGGRPGFVQVEAGGQALIWPDFTGNYLFNTLGNLLLDPRAGLVFVDFASGTQLHLAGTVEILWDGPLVQRYAGAQRVLRLQIREALLRPAALPLRAAGAAEISPALAGTGDWA